MKRYVILLRGVMPTGRNRVPMALLREALGEEGLVDVRTYIASGNVIASSALGTAKVEKLVHDVIEREFGGDLTVIARTASQFRELLANNPFPTAETSRVYFTLFATRPDPQRLAALLATDVSPERIEFVGDMLYTLYATKLSESKYHNNAYERLLKVAATTRNFNTMTKLVELTA